jgi:hypothetical protein
MINLAKTKQMIRINSVLEMLEYIIENSGETEFLVSEDVLTILNSAVREGDGYNLSKLPLKGQSFDLLGATFYEKEEDAIRNLV